MAVADALHLRGTPMLIWKTADGWSGRSDGIQRESSPNARLTECSQASRTQAPRRRKFAAGPTVRFGSMIRPLRLVLCLHGGTR
jgi:hypothetical protein